MCLASRCFTLPLKQQKHACNLLLVPMRANSRTTVVALISSVVADTNSGLAEAQADVRMASEPGYSITCKF
jgi:hypothetical protein